MINLTSCVVSGSGEGKVRASEYIRLSNAAGCPRREESEAKDMVEEWR